MVAKKHGEWEGGERRTAARVEAQIALQLSGADEALPSESITTESINIGSGGVYCHTAHFIAPLTKLQVVMLLPIRRRRGGVKNEVVKCSGVVVRCQPAGGESGGYRIACFFTDFQAGGQETLDEYVRQHTGR